MISLLRKADFQFHSCLLAFFILQGAGNLQTRFSRFPCQVVSSEIPPNAGLKKDQAREERRCLYHFLHLDQWQQATIISRSPGYPSNTSGTVGFQVLSASVRVQILSSRSINKYRGVPIAQPQYYNSCELWVPSYAHFGLFGFYSLCLNCLEHFCFSDQALTNNWVI